MDSPGRYRTVRARMRRTHVPSVGLRAIQRWAATRPKGSVQIAMSRRDPKSPAAAQPSDDLSVQEARLWLDVPSRWRYEVDTPGYGTAVYVVDPPLWWSYAPSVHAHSNEGDPVAYPAPAEHPESPFFHAERLLRGLAVKSIRPARRDDRDVEVVEAVAVGDVGPEIMPGAESYELVIDRERDIAIRFASRAEGIEYMVFEIVDLELDVPLPAGLFRVAPPPGTTFSPPPTFRPRSRLGRLLERFPLRWRGW